VDFAALRNLLSGWVTDLIHEKRMMWRDDGVDVGQVDIVDVLGACTKSGNKLTIGTLTAAVDADTLDTLHASAFTSPKYLVTEADANLTAEVVVGATPGGELGGTWASPTVDATHSGSAHHAVYTDAEAIAAVQGEATLDLAGDVAVAAAKTLTVNHINETTAVHGVQVEGVLIRDREVWAGVEDAGKGSFLACGDATGSDAGGELILQLAADHDAAMDAYYLRVIEDDLEISQDGGPVFKCKLDGSIEITAGPLKVDHLNEYTATHGVDIDGVLCKDDAVETDAIRGLRETSGPTALTVGTITDGEYLKRVAGTLVSGVPAGGGGGHTIQDEGGAGLTARTNLNFVGTGVAATDGGAGPDSTIVTIPIQKLDDAAAPDDNTDLNASNTAHGLLVKATVPGAADLLNVVGIATGATAYTNKVLYDATVPSAIGTASAGTGVVAARVNHVHALPAAQNDRVIECCIFLSPVSDTVPKFISHPMPFACTIISAEIKSYTICGATSQVIDIHKQTAANENTNTAATIWSTHANCLTLANTQYQADTTTFDVTALVAGDRLYVFSHVLGTGLTVAYISVTVRPTP